MKEVIIIQGGDTEFRNSTATAIGTMPIGKKPEPVGFVKYQYYADLDPTEQSKAHKLKTAEKFGPLPPGCPENYGTVVIAGCNLPTLSGLLELAGRFVANRVLLICEVTVAELATATNTDTDYNTLTITSKMLV